LAESLEAEVGLLNLRGEAAATDEDRLAYGLAIALALANAERLMVQRPLERPAAETTTREIPQVATTEWAA
jgi:hypothetical protein